jgi:hypothetical protein
MQREEMFAEMGWCLEVAEEVDEEVVWVGDASVFVPILRVMGFMLRVINAVTRLGLFCVAVREDNNFVDAKDGEGTGNLTGKSCTEIVGLGAEFISISIIDCRIARDSYL